MKKIKLFLTIGLSSLFLSSCASYNEMVPSWAEICSDPVDKSKAAWYKPCNLQHQSLRKFLKINFIYRVRFCYHLIILFLSYLYIIFVA